MADILIVEDETAINELVRRNLELVGHRCVSVYDGEEAKMCIRDRRIRSGRTIPSAALLWSWMAFRVFRSFSAGRMKRIIIPGL